jgi:hypothetical protein
MKQSQIDQYIDVIMDGMYRDYPELEERFGEYGKVKCREDNQHHFNHLKTAFTLGNGQFFIDYAYWLTNLLVSRGMKAAHVIDNFERIHNVLKDEPSDEILFYRTILVEAIAGIERREAK